MSNVVIHRDPFRPHIGAENLPVLPGLYIEQVLLDHEFLVRNKSGNVVRVGTFVVLLNGEPVLARDWLSPVNDGDVMQVAVMPKGGGGGSSIGNILAAVVIAVAAYFTFGLSLAATAAVGVGALAVLSLAGGVVPPPMGATGGGNESRSPTYSLSEQSNRARLLEAIPRIYGRMRTMPDLASQPYSVYEGNHQYLYQLFCLSVGEVAIEKMMVDDVDITQYEDAEVQIVRPGQAVTLFSDNVVTSESVQSIELLAPNNPNFVVAGPFTVSAPGKKVTKIAVDVGLPQGLGRVSETSTAIRPHSLTVKFEYQAIDDSGTGLGQWMTLVEKTFTLADKRPLIVSLDATVASGRYQVRGFRSSNEGDTTTFGVVQWISLRGYLPSTHVYGNVTMIALKMRATAVLNSSTARQFSVISTGMVSKWDPVNGWGPVVATANPVWIASDMLRNSDYGRGLETTRFNVANFYRLAGVCDARKDSFNGVFDTSSQLWSALTQVCRVFRAVPVYYAGVIDIVRDEPATLPTQVFTPGKIVAGTFRTAYNFFDVDTPDHVIIEYIDSTTWKTATVKCALPGEPSRKAKTVSFFGITNRDQAFREGISMAAANRDRRRTITFQTLNPGLIPEFNGLVRVSHDVPQWGYSGRVLALDKVTGLIRTSEPITIDRTTTNVIAFRAKNGSENGPFTLQATTEGNESDGVFVYRVVGTAEKLAAIYISDGSRSDYTFYTAGPSLRCGIKALVMSALPTNDGKVSLSLVNYADSVHSAENGGIVPPPGPESSLPGIPSAPIVNTVTVRYTVTVGEQNIVASPANGAIYYEFRAKLKDSSDYIQLGTSNLPTVTSQLSPGDWTVQVRGVGATPGPWATWTGTIEATSLPTPKLDLMKLSSDLFSVGVEWSYEAATATIAGNAEIWVSATNSLANAMRLISLPYPANRYSIANVKPGERRYVWGRVIDTAGRPGPWYSNGVALSEIASVEKTSDYLDEAIGESQLTAILREKINTPQVDLEPVYAAITEEREERITENRALAQAVTQTTAVANGAAADAQIAVRSVADINGEIGSSIALRAQVTRPDGKIVTSGVALGVTPNPAGELVSEFIVSADRIAFVHPSKPNEPLRYLLAMEGDNVFIRSAFINKLTVQEAMVGATLTSQAVITSGPNKNLPVRTDNYAAGTTTYRGVEFTRVDDSTGTKMTDLGTNVVVIQWGKI